MLGGSVYVAFIRMVVNLAGTILLFSLMSESRYDRKRTIICYGMFSAAAIVLACVWYIIDWSSYTRMVTFVLYMCFSVFAYFMGRDPVYLAAYKLALNFYLLAVVKHIK